MGQTALMWPTKLIVTGLQTTPKTRIMVGFQTGSTHNL